MSIIICIRCGELKDTDFNEGAWAEDNTFLCEDCCESEEINNE